MLRKFRFIFVFGVLTILVTASGQMGTHAQSGTAFLRAVHFITGGPKVDIYVDGTVVLSNLGFQDATTVVPISAGTHQVDWNVAGKGKPSGNPITLQAADNDFFTFVFSGTLENKTTLDVYMTSETGLAKQANLTLDSTTMPLLFVQGSKAVDAVDVYVNDKLAGSVKSGASLVAVVPLTAFKVKVTPAGDATKTLIESAGFSIANAVGVIGLTGPADKLSLDTAYSTSLSAGQFFDAQKGASAFTFNSLTSAITAANLANTLSGTGPLTIFAPTDAAFAKVDAGQLSQLMADPAAIGNVIKYHIIHEPLVLDDILNLALAPGTKTTLQGTDLSFEFKGKQLTLGGTAANLLAWNIHTSNAVIHIIDAVLMPAAK